MGSDLRQAGAVAYVYAFDRETGALRWKTPVGAGAMTDLAALDGLVFLVTLADELVALELETGRRRWSFASGAANDDFLSNSTPAVSGERIFFGSLDGTLRAFDAVSGNVLWKRELGARISTGVAAATDGVYVGTADGGLYRVRPETGEVAARADAEGPLAGRLTLSGACLLALAGESALSCWPRSLERARWRRTGPKPWTSSRPYVWNDVALAGTQAGEVFAFRLADGEIAWSQAVGGTIRGIGTSPEGFFAGTLKGEVHARPWPPAASTPAVSWR